MSAATTKTLVAFPYLPDAGAVRTALAKKDIPHEHAESITWLLGYGREQGFASISALARKVRIDPGTLSKVFAAKYPAELDNIIGRIDDLRIRERGRSDENQVLVRSLRISNEIIKFCELTYRTGTISILFGPNQSGKTWTLKKIYAPSNKHVVYVDMLPSRGGTTMFAQDLANELGGSPRQSIRDLTRFIFRKLTPRHLLVIDEFHQCLIGRTIKMATVEFVKSIYENGTPVVLSGTDIIPEMFSDKRFKKFLGQLDNRGALKRMIPSKPYPEDVDLLCKGYGLPKPAGDAKKKVDAITQTSGIGKLCKVFALAGILAEAEAKALTWDHFIDAEATRNSWETGDPMKESKS